MCDRTSTRPQPGEHFAVCPRIIGKLTTQMFEQVHDWRLCSTMFEPLRGVYHRAREHVHASVCARARSSRKRIAIVLTVRSQSEGRLSKHVPQSLIAE